MSYEATILIARLKVENKRLAEKLRSLTTENERLRELMRLILRDEWDKIVPYADSVGIPHEPPYEYELGGACEENARNTYPNRSSLIHALIQQALNAGNDDAIL